MVYAHHAFEHLSQRTAELFLREVRRVLRPNGVLRLVVPDLTQHAQEYLERLPAAGAEATDHFLSSINLRVPQHSNPLRSFYEKISGLPVNAQDDV